MKMCFYYKENTDNKIIQFNNSRSSVFSFGEVHCIVLNNINILRDYRLFIAEP